MKLLAFALVAAFLSAWIIKSLWTRAIELRRERELDYLDEDLYD